MIVREQQADRLRKWRLILGGGAADGIGGSCLSDRDLAMDGALAALYGEDHLDGSEDRKGGLGSSSPDFGCANYAAGRFGKIELAENAPRARNAGSDRA